MTHADDTIPVGFCQCGCGQRTKIASRTHNRYGHVKGQPMRYIRHHGNKRMAGVFDVEDRGYTTPCHVWNGTLSEGYGVIRHDNVIWKAHAFYWVQKNGPVPDGCELDHLCRVRACVNPDHLEPVSKAVNCQRGANAKLTPDDVRQIRALAGRLSHRKIASRFGVSRTTIKYVLIGRTWKNVV